jgi:hypothetical protein
MTTLRTRLAALAAAMTIISAAPAWAQSQQRHEGIGIGIKAGPVFADFSDEDDDLDFKKRTGLQGGVFFGGNRPGTVGVMAEVNFIQKKAEIPFSDQNLTLSYLQVPVFLRINGGSRSLSGVNVYGIVGPAVDIKVSDDAGDFDITDGFEGVDISLIGGVGVEITRFIIEGRYTWGLRRVNKEFNDVSDIKAKSFAILFGVRFN